MQCGHVTPTFAGRLKGKSTHWAVKNLVKEVQDPLLLLKGVRDVHTHRERTR